MEKRVRISMVQTPSRRPSFKYSNNRLPCHPLACDGYFGCEAVDASVEDSEKSVSTVFTTMISTEKHSRTGPARLDGWPATNSVNISDRHEDLRLTIAFRPPPEWRFRRESHNGTLHQPSNLLR